MSEPAIDSNVIVRRPSDQYRDDQGRPLFVTFDENGGKAAVYTESELIARNITDAVPLSVGQGSTTATSAKTGWVYEHDETDAQINAIEGLIEQVRDQAAADGPPAPGAPKRGDTFSWSSTTPEGEGIIVIGTAYVEPGDGVVNLGAAGIHTGFVWAEERWEIDPDGTVRAGVA